MTRRTSGVAIAACLMTLAAQSGALAQTTGTTGTTGSTGPSGSVQLGTSGENAGVGLSSTGSTGGGGASMSATDQLAAAEAIVQRATRLSERLTQLLDEARREADVIRVTCLNDKLTQVNANLRTAQNRLASLQKATDQEQRNHEFTVLSVLGQKFQVLEQRANQCIGQDLYETGPTKVITEIDTSLLPFENEPGTPPMMLPTAPLIPTDVPVTSASD